MNNICPVEKNKDYFMEITDIGNEGEGVSAYFLDNSDYKVIIPMKGEVESLNAAVAGSILMYETAR